MSDTMSFKGYSFLVWVQKNKDNIKQLAAIGFGLLAATYQDSAMMQTLFGLGSGIITRLALDALDYFLSPTAN